MNRKHYTTIFTILASFLAPALCFAEEEHHAGSIGDLTFYYINFALYILFLYFVLRKPVRQGWVSRSLKIEEAVNRGKIELAKAEEALKAAKNQLAGVDSEIKKIGEEIRADTRNETKLIVDDAKVRAERIVQQGKLSAQSEIKALEQSLRRELASLIMQKATEQVRAKINTEADVKLRRSSLSGISGLRQ